MQIDYEVPANTRIILLGKSNYVQNSFLDLLKMPLLAWKYLRFCKTEKIDISFSFLTIPNLINSLIKIYNWKGFSILSERTSTYTYYNTKTFLSKTIALRLIKCLYPKANMIVPNSFGVEQELKNKLFIKNNFIIINNPIDLAFVSKQKNDSVLTQFDEFSYIYVARFHKEKNHELLIKAFEKLQFKINAKLYFLGVGEYMDTCKSYVRQAGLEDKIIFLGFDKNPYKYLAKADCFVMASNFEGFPNVLVEALACGLAVISTDCCSGPREILAPNTNLGFQLKDGIEYATFGILTPIHREDCMSEAMLNIYENHSKRQHYQSNAFNRAKDYDVQFFLKNVKKLLNKDYGDL